MTPAPACLVADFKNCCMLTGQFDGSDRHHFFQRVRMAPSAVGAVVMRGWLGAAGPGRHCGPAAPIRRG